MLVKTLDHVRGNELSAHLLERMGFYPDQVFNVTLELVEDTDNLPPEEAFREDFIQEVEQASKDYREGTANGALCRTKEESEAFFERLWNE
ncbi:MAG: hypothetical protein HQK56_19140 [Deltaproteobacteria bacterium]|nr:hypothetical protein [Deltaproteobacteria bacterium]